VSVFSRPLIPGETPVATLADWLKSKHYLGPTFRGLGWSDDYGCMVLSKPTSRRLPSDGSWFELSRWCLDGDKNGGSKQWSSVRSWIISQYPSVTTVVSYSDPGAGHTGSLYRACGWLWAPTWHRLRPPPTGNGKWARAVSQDGESVEDEIQTTKDRWVDCLRPDDRRAEILAVNDDAIMRKSPWAQFIEPKVRKNLCVRGTGGGDYKRWVDEKLQQLD